MLSILTYKALHLTGLFMAFMGLAALVVAAAQDADKATRRKAIIFHGLGLTVALVAGFGMAGKMGLMSSFPLWLAVKTVLWVLLGALPVLIRRVPGAGKLSWWALPLIGLLAAWLGLSKPF